MKISIVTDAWYPQMNGVVRTYEQTGERLRALGHDVRLITPDGFWTVPCPTYPSIRLVTFPSATVSRMLQDYQPDAVHIATEGPLGYAAWRYCRKQGIAFTTSFHTRFPEYIRARAPIPIRWTYAWLRRFHGAASRTLVPTPSQRQQLRSRGFEHLELWSRGVDTGLFKPRDKSFLDVPRPLSVYVGRVAVEKNIDAFLNCDIPGTRMVIGDGPELERLQKAHPEALFTGMRQGEDLARHLAAADVFVFPSRTDTFGIVMLEAMACGVPVAAYPVTGPKDVVRDGVTGALHDDLATAVQRALQLNPADCEQYARAHTWDSAADQFLGWLVPSRIAA